MRKNLLGVLLLLSLFSSMGFTSPVYVDCRNPEPDEWPDFFGRSNSPRTLKVIPETQPAALSDVISNNRMFQVHRSRHLSAQPSISVPILSSLLRC